MNSSDYAKDKDRGAVQADLPPGRKGHEELQLQLPKLHFSRVWEENQNASGLTQSLLGVFCTQELDLTRPYLFTSSSEELLEKFGYIRNITIQYLHPQ